MIGRYASSALRPGLVAIALLAASGCDEVQVVRVPHRLDVTPNPVDFGEVALAQTKTIAVTLANPSIVAVEITSCARSDDTEPVFSLGECPTFIPSGTSARIDIAYAPMVENRARGKILIETRDDDIGVIEIDLKGFGVDLGTPQITVTPEGVSYPPTAVGDTGLAPVTIGNIGTNDLYVSEVAVICPESLICPFRPISVASMLGEAIASGLTAQFRIAFEPPELLEYRGILRITSNDINQRVVEVPISGQGHQPPLALAILVNDPDRIEPLDQVVFDGRTSHSPVEELTITQYHWSLLRRPPGSTSTIDDADRPEAGLTADLAGDFTVELHVVDSMGVRSVEPALIMFRAIPRDALHIQLTWDHPDADLDLHFLRHNEAQEYTPFTMEYDTYFSNRFPDSWYPEEQNHPRLDVDDQRGFGPDNINITLPAEETFQIWVHYWNDNQQGNARTPTVATIRVYVHGMLHHEVLHEFEEDQMMWKAVQLDWPDLNFRNLEETFPYERPF
jgi:hypothetical protein